MRFIFECQFLGKNFSGSQKQNNGRSVQEELEKAFCILFSGEKIKISLGSRVDAGVHAKSMIGHFDIFDIINLQTNTAEKILNNNYYNLCRHVNGILACNNSQDLAVLRIQKINNNFNSRRDAISRTYIYKLRAKTNRFPLDESQVAYISSKLNLKNLNEQARILIGSHDCLGLSRDFEYKINTVCDIQECFWTEIEQDFFVFKITASHFLYKMVRNIIGTQIDSESGRIPVYSLERSLRDKNRQCLGQTASANGLCLEKINYNFNIFEI